MHLLPGEVLGTSRLVLNTIISNQRRRRNDLNTAIFILAFVALMVEPVDDLPGILEIDDEGAGLLPAAVGDDTESLPRGTSVASKEYYREQDLMDLALEYADEVLPPLDGPGTQEHVASRAWRHYQQHLTEEDDNTDYFDSGNSDSSDDDDENSDGGDGDDENDENDSVDDG
ncbi:hypothetical protein M419DRAFT_7508 [Trichoderma reesei RUT C-30]|uniref:Uncharacterized protein n=1 Tax=Hypocrea jecorina (strain ATCC 56765 / BCRC 32924 / NRRL 11460 / Rut C-30) TaxID=1344414 RepID=A0A024SBG8_HYPJR|nr:hypothetical protein M419DRAFT_7508 [Trichoderma reesei RUT C-30]